MAKETVIAISDSSESSTGSNGDCHSATAPSVGAHDSECSSAAPAPPTTHTPSTNHLTPTSNKQNLRRVATTLSPPLPPTRSNKTAAVVISSSPPPPPPRSNRTMTLVRIAPRPSAATALPKNSNAVGSGARQRVIVDVASSRPNGGGSKAHHPGGATFSLALVAGENSDSSKRTVDFLSQMEAGSSAPREVPRGNPPNEMLAEWAATLRLGNGRNRSMDLNLKLN